MYLDFALRHPPGRLHRPSAEFQAWAALALTRLGRRARARNLLDQARDRCPDKKFLQGVVAEAGEGSPDGNEAHQPHMNTRQG